MPEGATELRATGHAIPRIAYWIATGAGSGLLRPAPGTWGSLLASVIGYVWLSLATPDFITWGLAVAALSATCAGVWAAGVYGRSTGIADAGPVVIDEVAGVWTTLLLIPPTLAIASPFTASILGFLSFRLFDIVKPWPISALERLPRGWGVMADDLGAGMVAGVLTGALLR